MAGFGSSRRGSRSASKASRGVDSPVLFTENYLGRISPQWTDYELGKHTASPRETPATSPNVVIEDAPGRPGEKCWKLTLEPDDYTTAATQSNNRQRAELIYTNPNVGLAGSDWWFGWSIRIPNGYILDNIGSGTKWEIIGQIHSGPGVTSGPQPVISLRHEADGTDTGDLLFVRCGLVSDHGDIVGEDPSAGGETEHRIRFAIARETWVDVKLHVGFAIGNGNGYVEAYKNGVLVTDVNSWAGGVYTPIVGTNGRAIVGTMYNAEPPDFRLGLYSGADPNPHTDTRTIRLMRVRGSRVNNF